MCFHGDQMTSYIMSRLTQRSTEETKTTNEGTDSRPIRGQVVTAVFETRCDVYYRPPSSLKCLLLSHSLTLLFSHSLTLQFSDLMFPQMTNFSDWYKQSSCGKLLLTSILTFVPITVPHPSYYFGCECERTREFTSQLLG